MGAPSPETQLILGMVRQLQVQFGSLQAQIAALQAQFVATAAAAAAAASAGPAITSTHWPVAAAASSLPAPFTASSAADTGHSGTWAAPLLTPQLAAAAHAQSQAISALALAQAEASRYETRRHQHPHQLPQQHLSQQQHAHLAEPVQLLTQSQMGMTEVASGVTSPVAWWDMHGILPGGNSFRDNVNFTEGQQDELGVNSFGGVMDQTRFQTALSKIQRLRAEVQVEEVCLADVSRWIAETAGASVLQVVHLKGSSTGVSDIHDAPLLEALQDCALLVWDGDPYEETSFTRIVPKFLEAWPGRRIMAFRLNYQVDGLKESWASVAERYPGRFAVVPVELRSPALFDAARLGVLNELELVKDCPELAQKYFLLGRIAIKVTGATHVVALGGGGIAVKEAVASLESGVQWTVFALSQGTSEQAFCLADWAASEPQRVRLVRPPDSQQAPLGTSYGPVIATSPPPPRIVEESSVSRASFEGTAAGARARAHASPTGRDKATCKSCHNLGVDFTGKPCSCRYGRRLITSESSPARLGQGTDAPVPVAPSASRSLGDSTPKALCKGCGNTGVDFMGRPCSCSHGRRVSTAVPAAKDHSRLRSPPRSPSPTPTAPMSVVIGTPVSRTLVSEAVTTEISGAMPGSGQFHHPRTPPNSSATRASPEGRPHEARCRSCGNTGVDISGRPCTCSHAAMVASERSLPSPNGLEEARCRSCGNTGVDVFGKNCTCPFGRKVVFARNLPSPPLVQEGQAHEARCRSCGNTGIDIAGKPCACSYGAKVRKCWSCNNTGVDFAGKPCTCRSSLSSAAQGSPSTTSNHKEATSSPPLPEGSCRAGVVTSIATASTSVVEAEVGSSLDPFATEDVLPPGSPLVGTLYDSEAMRRRAEERLLAAEGRAADVCWSGNAGTIAPASTSLDVACEIGESGRGVERPQHSQPNQHQQAPQQPQPRWSSLHGLAEEEQATVREGGGAADAHTSAATRERSEAWSRSCAGGNGVGGANGLRTDCGSGLDGSTGTPTPPPPPRTHGYTIEPIGTPAPVLITEAPVPMPGDEARASSPLPAQSASATQAWSRSCAAGNGVGGANGLRTDCGSGLDGSTGTPTPPPPPRTHGYAIEPIGTPAPERIMPTPVPMPADEARVSSPSPARSASATQAWSRSCAAGNGVGGANGPRTAGTHGSSLRDDHRHFGIESSSLPHNEREGSGGSGHDGSTGMPTPPPPPHTHGHEIQPIGTPAPELIAQAPVPMTADAARVSSPSPARSASATPAGSASILVPAASLSSTVPSLSLASTAATTLPATAPISVVGSVASNMTMPGYSSSSSSTVVCSGSSVTVTAPGGGGGRDGSSGESGAISRLVGQSPTTATSSSAESHREAVQQFELWLQADPSRRAVLGVARMADSIGVGIQDAWRHVAAYATDQDLRAFARQRAVAGSQAAAFAASPGARSGDRTPPLPVLPPLPPSVGTTVAASLGTTTTVHLAAVPEDGLSQPSRWFADPSADKPGWDGDSALRSGGVGGLRHGHSSATDLTSIPRLSLSTSGAASTTYHPERDSLLFVGQQGLGGNHIPKSTSPTNTDKDMLFACGQQPSASERDFWAAGRWQDRADVRR